MTDEDIKKIKKEAEILRKLNHPNIIKYLGVRYQFALTAHRNSKALVHNHGEDGRRDIGKTST